MTNQDPQRLRTAMVDALASRSLLTSRRWQGTFATVGRHWFLARFFQQANDRNGWEPIDPAHPRWLSLAHADTAWALELDHDENAWDHACVRGRVTGNPTRWSLTPSTSAAMVEALDVQDGQRVLCLDDATGYHPALLAHRLTAGNITAVESNRHNAERARSALSRAGYPTPVFVAESSGGFPQASPYQRILAVTPLERVPQAWLEQAHAGALIVAVLRGALTEDPIVRLTVSGDGTAEGRFLPVTATRPPSGGLSLPPEAAGQLRAALEVQRGGTRRTDLHPDVLACDFGHIAGLHNLLTHFLGRLTPADTRYWLLSHDGQSWAAVDTEPGEVVEHGPRKLWNEVEIAHQRWVIWGSPRLHCTGITITRAGENWLWIDKPVNKVARL